VTVLVGGQTVWAAGALSTPAAGVYLGIWANPALAPNQEAAIEIRGGSAPNGINRLLRCICTITRGPRLRSN
jgi:hypothetical protein